MPELQIRPLTSRIVQLSTFDLQPSIFNGTILVKPIRKYVLSTLPRITTIVLAAGFSQRMQNQDKLMLTIDDQPLLRRTAIAALESNSIETIVVIQFGQNKRFQSITDLELQITLSFKAQYGMSMSLRSGIASISEEVDGVMILLADMPEINKHEINMLIDAFELGKIVVAGANGSQGNPVILPKRLFYELMQIRGDKGAREIINKHHKDTILVDKFGNKALLDIDTEEDWLEWQNKIRVEANKNKN